ncbi:MAG TPA: hypothetical protein ENI79_03745 [Rhodospirillales bacterium]|nr:hypothetical protein [Rhodospirillales bacterium]
MKPKPSPSRNHTLLLKAALCLALTASTATAAKAPPILGPYTARVISIQDGDTLTVDVPLWPGLTMRTKVRLAGIDAPELKAACKKERALAIQARTHLTTLATPQVRLTDVRLGKYAGRVVARVLTMTGEDVSAVMLSKGLARAYDGGKREGWCD